MNMTVTLGGHRRRTAQGLPRVCSRMSHVAHCSEFSDAVTVIKRYRWTCRISVLVRWPPVQFTWDHKNNGTVILNRFICSGVVQPLFPCMFYQFQMYFSIIWNSINDILGYALPELKSGRTLCLKCSMSTAQHAPVYSDTHETDTNVWNTREPITHGARCVCDVCVPLIAAFTDEEQLKNNMTAIS